MTAPRLGLNREQAAYAIGVPLADFDLMVDAGELLPGCHVAGREYWGVRELDDSLRRLPYEDGRRQEVPSIYFIAMETAPYVKVGWAKRVWVRRLELQTGNPEPLCVLATLPGERRDESRLHDALREHRTVGEWFRRGTWLKAARKAIIQDADVDGVLESIKGVR
jgi:hypothetical protein